MTKKPTDSSPEFVREGFRSFLDLDEGIDHFGPQNWILHQKLPIWSVSEVLNRPSMSKCDEIEQHVISGSMKQFFFFKGSGRSRELRKAGMNYFHIFWSPVVLVRRCGNEL